MNHVNIQEGINQAMPHGISIYLIIVQSPKLHVNYRNIKIWIHISIQLYTDSRVRVKIKSVAEQNTLEKPG